MNRAAVVTGADRGLGFAMCEMLLAKGWMVFAGQFIPDWPQLKELEQKYPNMLQIVPMDVGSEESVQNAAKAVAKTAEQVDLMINNAGIPAGRGELRGEINYSGMHNCYNVNSLGPIRMVNAFLPLMDKSSYKRLCFVSSEASSITLCCRDDSFGYPMSKTALNMAVRLMYNQLRPEGYTFRLYQPGWMRSYMTGKKSERGDLEPEESASAAVPFFINPQEDENRLVLMDYKGRELSF